MPATVPIPAWNAEGLLPPVDRANPVSPNRSPYPVSLGDVVMRFSTSPDRIAILTGFLNYRAALHTAGLTTGFQWFDGSFVEHIEAGARKRPPDDVDVITFYRVPVRVTQAELVARHPELFPTDASGIQAQKDLYKVDARTVHLGQSADRLVDRSAYWSGVWGHQRDTFIWKGFLQIDLSPTDDAAARILLAASSTGATP
jgi:hypothetical protein